MLFLLTLLRKAGADKQDILTVTEWEEKFLRALSWMQNADKMVLTPASTSVQVSSFNTVVNHSILATKTSSRCYRYFL